MKKEIFITFGQDRKTYVVSVLAPYLSTLEEPMIKDGTWMAKILVTPKEWRKVKSHLIANC